MATARATKSAAPAVDVEEVSGEVYALIDRIKPLIIEHNHEGAAELTAEAEAIISNALKGNKVHVVRARKALRDALAEANKAPAPSTEVATVPQAEAVVVDEVALEALVALGAEQVKNISSNSVGGALRVAEFMLEIRRRVIVDGVPDLKGDSKFAQRLGRDIYNRVLKTLAKDESGDPMRDAIKKLKKDVENVSRNVRVEYIRGLDNPGNEDERAKYPFIDAESELPVSQQVADFYGFQLLTNAEIAKAKREAKALEAAKVEEESSEGKEESAPSKPTVPLTPAQRIRSMVDTVSDEVGGLDETEDDAVVASVNELGDEGKAALAADLRTRIAEMTAILALIEA